MAVTITVAATIGEPLAEPTLQQMLEPVEGLDGMMLGRGWMLQALGAMLQLLQLPSQVVDGKGGERSPEYRQALSSRACPRRLVRARGFKKASFFSGEDGLMSKMEANSWATNESLKK